MTCDFNTRELKARVFLHREQEGCFEYYVSEFLTSACLRLLDSRLKVKVQEVGAESLES